MASLDPAAGPLVARPARRAASEGGDDRARRGASRAPRPAAGRHGRRGAAAPARAPRGVPPARGATPVVGVVPLAAARRGRARRRPHRARRPSVGRAAADGGGPEPRVPHDVPAAGAQDLERGLRPGDASGLPHTGRRRPRGRHRPPQRQPGRRADPDRVDPGAPFRRRREA